MVGEKIDHCLQVLLDYTVGFVEMLGAEPIFKPFWDGWGGDHFYKCVVCLCHYLNLRGGDDAAGVVVVG